VRLFLFDVDGTLVSARGAGRVALARALERVFGVTGPIDGYDFRGRTDPRIVRDLMQAAGIAPDDVDVRLGECLATYVAELDAVIGDGARVQLMPGIADVVRALARREDALVGLLTGNIEGGARVKLRPTGLWPIFRVGAFGSDDMDRRRLPAVACARARALVARDFPFERVTIIGDTPLDVDCARACGAVAVAVATGHHGHDELAACRPDHLFVDFSDVDAAMRALTGSAGDT
jgi:phosphoglycolate phosphatase